MQSSLMDQPRGWNVPALWIGALLAGVLLAAPAFAASDSAASPVAVQMEEHEITAVGAAAASRFQNPPQHPDYDPDLAGQKAGRYAIEHDRPPAVPLPSVLPEAKLGELTLTLDASREGRVFEGVGGVSAGASSRLLFDYTEPQRSEVLDYLFKPNYGASLQHLKVEIGGEVNSTDGSEPTHMRSRTDTNYTRGYEWWLMVEARKRNPAILLDTLAWGAPGWIGNGNYFSQDMADYVANFLEGARDVHGLDIDYTGVRNERGFSASWIKLLRQTLDARGFGSVKIVADDDCCGGWGIANAIASDPALGAAVHALSSHYTSSQSSATAKALGKPLWNGEELGGKSWGDALRYAALVNLNYIDGRMTKTEIWALVSSYSDNLIAKMAGLMRANTPWSGSYDVGKSIWGFAHTSQFAQPGWRILEGDGARRLPAGGSLVTYKAPDGTDYSVVAETGASGLPQTIRFALRNGLSTNTVHVWRSTASESFVQLDDVTPVEGSFSYTLQPGCIYSFTTTTGQGKGNAVPPPRAIFAMPYQDDFENYPLGATPKFTLDQSGAFEVAERCDGEGRCLQQMMLRTGIPWQGDYWPYTLFGDLSWQDYEVSVDVSVQSGGFAFLMGRVGTVPGAQRPTGYYLTANSATGGWELGTATGVLAYGMAGFKADEWHHLRLAMRGSSIQAWIDHVRVANLEDRTYAAGMAAFGCAVDATQFDNLAVRRIHPLAFNLAPLGKASASSARDAVFAAESATDGDPGTSWISAWQTSANEWIQLEFAKPVRFNQTAYREYQERITAYRIQHWKDGAWVDDFVGGPMGEFRQDTFAPVSASKVRLLMTSFWSIPEVFEFGIYDAVPPSNLALAATATASSSAGNGAAATLANDGKPDTRWLAAAGTSSNEWLQLEFTVPPPFNQTVIVQQTNRVSAYAIQAWNGTDWFDVVSGTGGSSVKTDSFPTVVSSRVRFYVSEATGPAAISEFRLFHDAFAGLRINEWMTGNQRTVADPVDGILKPWFELHNSGSTDLDLGGCALSSLPDQPDQFIIPPGWTLPAGGYLLVWADGNASMNQPPSGALHANFDLRGAPLIALRAPDGQLIDAVNLEPQASDTSSGSLPDGELIVTELATATPAGSNLQLRVRSIVRRADGQDLAIEFTGLPFAGHRVESASDLRLADWVEVAVVRADAFGNFRFTDSLAHDSPQRFYRLRLPAVQ